MRIGDDADFRYAVADIARNTRQRAGDRRNLAIISWVGMGVVGDEFVQQLIGFGVISIGTIVVGMDPRQIIPR